MVPKYKKKLQVMKNHWNPYRYVRTSCINVDILLHVDSTFAIWYYWFVRGCWACAFCMLDKDISIRRETYVKKIKPHLCLMYIFNVTKAGNSQK